jgi:oligoribonuclease
MTKKEEVTKLLWLDMEMTGLEVEKEVPIEVAAIVTDWNFHDLGQYHAIIRQPQHYLDHMDDWNKKHHGESGLTAQIPNGRDPGLVDQQLADLVTTHFGGERAILAGNSINQDRLFIHKYLPRFESKLHYRMLDVTAWKIVFNGLLHQKFDKNGAHRAVDDIRESIAEFKFYLSFVKP